MSTGPRIPLAGALDIAANALGVLRPHCHKADLAGSGRRRGSNPPPPIRPQPVGGYQPCPVRRTPNPPPSEP